jgi:hypothetical protein
MSILPPVGGTLELNTVNGIFSLIRASATYLICLSEPPTILLSLVSKREAFDNVTRVTPTRDLIVFSLKESSRSYSI